MPRRRILRCEPAPKPDRIFEGARLIGLLGLCAQMTLAVRFLFHLEDRLLVGLAQVPVWVSLILCGGAILFVHHHLKELRKS